MSDTQGCIPNSTLIPFLVQKKLTGPISSAQHREQGAIWDVAQVFAMWSDYNSYHSATRTNHTFLGSFLNHYIQFLKCIV
jgi:hypothetical protein